MQDGQKDLNKEVEDILSEAPLIIENNKKKSNVIDQPIPTPKKKKASKKNIKKIVLTIAVVIVLLFGASFLFGDKDCETQTQDTMSNSDFVNIVKQQILSQGYADLIDGTTTIRVSPHMG